MRRLIHEFSKTIPQAEVRILLCAILGISLEELFLYPNEISPQILEELRLKLEQRSLGMPIAYLTGKKEFYGYEFYVSESVLIPRPETEMIIDEVKALSNGRSDLSILDLCTGSGAIAVAASLETGNNILATDISDKALEILKKNIQHHKLLDKITFLQSDWFLNIEAKNFDIITCNPPYISLNDTDIIADETIKFEPHIALFSGESGLESYQTLAEQSHHYLKRGGNLILEIGISQGEKICNIFKNGKFELEKIKKDLSGIERVMSFRKI